jgi:exopolysaccharide biosynthesis polyprenyl glycosylphosphotransferase
VHREKARLLRSLTVALDAVVVAVAVLPAYFLRQALPDEMGSLYPLSYYLWLPFAAMVLWPAGLALTGIYRSGVRLSPLDTLVRIVAGGIVANLALAGAMVVFKQHGISRLLLGIWFLLAVAAVAAVRVAIVLAVQRLGRGQRFALILGSPSRAGELAGWLRTHDGGYEIAGYLDWTGGEEEPSDGELPRLGTLEDLTRLLETRSVDEVVLELVPHRWEEMQRALALCEEVGVDVRIRPDIFGAALAKAYVDDLGGAPVLTYTTVPSHPGALLLKQALDYTLAGTAVVLLAPVMAATALLIKWTSPGPVLFRQERCGRNGRRFMLYKFRSMVRDAEQLRKELLDRNEMSGPVFKIARDPRVTPIGRFLRKTSLDELPQLFNVLRGEMSLVGPRPPIPEEVAQYERWQRRRLSMKPGITCLWQVNGRNEIDFEEWMKLDLHYIDTWSLKLDLLILLRTVGVVLSSRGAR